MNNTKKMMNVMKKIYFLLPPVAKKIGDEKRRKLKAS